MKRWAGILLAAVLAVACCGCSMQKAELSVAPSSFSRETTEVLRPFQSELQFVDLTLNEDAKQWKISLWSYRDGEWEEGSMMFDKVKEKPKSLRVAIRLTTKECDLYLIDEDGFSKASYSIIGTNFEQTQTVIDQRIEQKTPFAIGEEVTLWAKLGVDGQQVEAGDLTKDFRSFPCTAGAAVTVTISNEEPQEQQE